MKKKFSNFFFENFFFKFFFPKILVRSRTNWGEKEWHSRMWKKNSKKNFQNFFFKFFFPKFWYGREPIGVKKNKTPSVVTVGLGCCAAENDLVFSLKLKFRNINGFQFDTYIHIFEIGVLKVAESQFKFCYIFKKVILLFIFYEKKVLRFSHLQFVQTRNTLRHLQMYKLYANKFYQIPFFLSSAF